MNISDNIASMNANTSSLAANSYNLANVNTRGFKREEAIISQKNDSPSSYSRTSDEVGSNISKDIPQMIVYHKGFEANIPVIKTENEMLDSLLDIKV